MMPKVASEWRTFKCITASRNAFWKITEPYKREDIGSWAVRVHFGKNGTKGSEREKLFISKHEAKMHYIKIISEKYVKGYVEEGNKGLPDPVGYLTKKPVKLMKKFKLQKLVLTHQQKLALKIPPQDVDVYEESNGWMSKKKKAAPPSLPPVEQKKKRRMNLGRFR